MNDVELWAVQAALTGQGLMRWQRAILDAFPREAYVDVPEPWANMWRHATWERFASDTVACCGTQMAALLSLAYRPRVVVEMGLDCGFTTLQLCRMNPEARVYGVDRYATNRTTGLPIAYHAVRNRPHNLEVVVRPAHEFAATGVGLCFIDADHEGDAPYLDSRRAWENRDAGGDWCIAWDDYHPSNADVVRAVDRFCAEVGMAPRQVGSWYYIGTKPHSALDEWLEHCDDTRHLHEVRRDQA